MSERLSRRLELDRSSERRRAARTLLANPLLLPRGPQADEFVLVRRHADHLRRWFDRETGWRLRVEPELARLEKVPADATDGTRPALDRQGRPLTRRRYVLLCLALAALERSEAQTTLGQLAEEVLLMVTDEEFSSVGLTFSLETRDERGDLVAVVRALLALGVLSRISGDEDAFVASGGDVLYDVDRHVLAALLVAPRGPSLLAEVAPEDRLTELLATTPPLTDDARNHALRQRLTRRLLDDPVLLAAELDADERAYLLSQRRALVDRVEEFTGLRAEIRAEGVAMVDPADDLTDLRMPEDGTDGHVALLVAERLLDADPDAVPVRVLHAMVASQASRYAAYWRKDARLAGAEVGLVTIAVDRLEALHLARRETDAVRALPRCTATH